VADSAGQIGDAELVRAVIDGDRKAYGRLVDRYLGSVYGVALKMVSNRADAEDLTQDVFVRALQKLDQFASGFSFRNWLLKITTNLAINHLRSRKRERLRLPRIAEVQQQTAEDNQEGSGRGCPGREGVDPTGAGTKPDAHHPADGIEAAPPRQDTGATIESTPAHWQPLLARLSEAERASIVLFHFQGLSYLEVAEALGLPLNSVRTHLHRGRRKLKELLATRGLPESDSWTVAI